MEKENTNKETSEKITPKLAKRTRSHKKKLENIQNDETKQVEVTVKSPKKKARKAAEVKSTEPSVEVVESDDTNKEVIIVESNSQENKPQEEKGTNTLYVGGLAYDTTGDTLVAFLKKRKIKTVDCKIALKKGKSRGFAFVEFDSPEEVEKCLQLKKRELDGKTICFEKPASSKKTRKEKTEKKIEKVDTATDKEIKEVITLVTEVNNANTHPKKLKRFLFRNNIRSVDVLIKLQKAYIHFEDQVEADKCLKLNETFEGKALTFVPDGCTEIEERSTEPTNILFVKNIHKDTTTKDLTEAFPSSLAVRRKKNDGVPTGYTFVDFESIEAAKKVLDKMNGKEMDGKVWKIEFAKDDKSRKRKQNSLQMDAKKRKSEFPRSYGQTPTNLIQLINLPPAVNEERLSSLFSGSKEVKLIQKKSTDKSKKGSFKNMAFVKYATVEEALQGRKKLTGRKVDGKYLTMIYRDPNQSAKK